MVCVRAGATAPRARGTVGAVCAIPRAAKDPQLLRRRSVVDDRGAERKAGGAVQAGTWNGLAGAGVEHAESAVDALRAVGWEVAISLCIMYRRPLKRKNGLASWPWPSPQAPSGLKLRSKTMVGEEGGIAAHPMRSTQISKTLKVW